MGMATFILDEARRKEKREFKPVVPTPPAVQKPIVQNVTSEPPLTAQAKAETSPAPAVVKAEEPKKEEVKLEEPKKEEPKKEEVKPEPVKAESKLKVRK